MAAPIAIGAVDALVSNTNGCKAVPVRPCSMYYFGQVANFFYEIIY